MNNFYNEKELKNLGLKSFGQNVLISKKCSLYGAENISIGSNVRIDDFCILSGNIEIGNYVHIAAGSYLFGADVGIKLSDFSGISSRCSIYSVTDDYSGISLTNPTVPGKYKKLSSGKVILEKHVIVGAGTVILPNVVIAEGTSVGAMSMITKSTLPWKIYFGAPARAKGDRSQELLELEKQLYSEG